MTPKFITIDGKRFLWRDILELRRQQIEASRRVAQPVLFELAEDYRPPSQRRAAGRYAEPLLFEQARE